jgi:exodeoxyribonuclease VII large subunit
LKPVRVSLLNSYIGRLLSADPVLANISVIGEISNFRRHDNGHVYFSLKDDGARVNCFMPGQVFESLRCGIGDGDEATATGRINVYERGGSYSLNVRELTVEGAGGLATAFERTKAKLAAEGLFDQAAKKPIPAFPTVIAIVTSGTGAAIGDMLKIISAKNKVVDVLIYPTLVQGPEAAARIADGIEYINGRYPDTDVIITGRGGGSAEELWAFNEEVVARAIYGSEIPVISAVGHETDVTIADFVADVRAETPTAAADIAAPDIAEVRRGVDSALRSMGAYLSDRLERMSLLMDACAMPRLREMLGDRIELSRVRAAGAFDSARSGVGAAVGARTHKAISAYERLKASDPARIMAMGYAALTKDGGSIRSAADIGEGDSVSARLADGSAELTVNVVRIDKKAERGVS